MRASRRLTTAAILLCLGACRTRPDSGETRLLILPLENLTADASLDWQGRLAPALLAYDLRGVKGLFAFAGDSERVIASSLATRVLQGYFVNQGGQLTVRYSEEDPAARKTIRIIDRSGPEAASLEPLLDSIAKEIAPGARRYPVRDQTALRTYSDGLLNLDNAARARLFETAIQLDPKFTPAYVALSEALLAVGDRASAAQVAQKGVAATNDPADRDELAYLVATAQNDTAAREKALEALTRTTPGDPELFRALGDVHMRERRFPAAAKDYEALTRLEPSESIFYNQLGYARAYAHDLDGAKAAFASYAERTPASDVNPIDSLGEAYFVNGDFKNATQTFEQAFRKNPAYRNGLESLRAAQGNLLNGNLPAADALFLKYLAAQHLNGVQAQVLAAQWQFITGRRRRAMSALERLASTPEEAGALAAVQLTLFRVQTGDRAGAQKTAAAIPTATSAQGKSLVSLARFIAASPVAQSQFPFVNAVALILNRQFAQAVPILEPIYAQTDPAADAQVRTLLAWCYVQTGQMSKAAALADRYPIFWGSGDSLFTSLVFPRYLQVRAAVLEAEHKPEKARLMRELYLKYVGDISESS